MDDWRDSKEEFDPIFDEFKKAFKNNFDFLDTGFESTFELWNTIIEFDCSSKIDGESLKEKEEKKAFETEIKGFIPSADNKNVFSQFIGEINQKDNEIPPFDHLPDSWKKMFQDPDFIIKEIPWATKPPAWKNKTEHLSKASAMVLVQAKCGTKNQLVRYLMTLNDFPKSPKALKAVYRKLIKKRLLIPGESPNRYKLTPKGYRLGERYQKKMADDKQYKINDIIGADIPGFITSDYLGEATLALLLKTLYSKTGTKQNEWPKWLSNLIPKKEQLINCYNALERCGAIINATATSPTITRFGEEIANAFLKQVEKERKDKES